MRATETTVLGLPDTRLSKSDKSKRRYNAHTLPKKLRYRKFVIPLPYLSLPGIFSFSSRTAAG